MRRNFLLLFSVLLVLAATIAFILFSAGEEEATELPRPENPEGPRGISSLTFREVEEAARGFGMECRDDAPSGDSPVVLGSCKSDFEGEGGRYEVDVLGDGAGQVGQVSASVDGCEEGSRERAEALDLLGTMATLAYEDDGQGERARRWVESNFSGGGQRSGAG